MRNACLDMIYQLAKQDPRILFIGSDLGVGTLQRFKEEMPERFLMEGVSEANIVGLAAGLALEGWIPYVATIATFLTRRCFEQVVLDVGLHQVPVRLIGFGGGLVYAPLGPTHEAIEDLAILRTVPNMSVIAPADADEMRRLMPLTVEHPGPLYVRVAKGHDPIVTRPEVPVVIGKAVPMRGGSDALIVTTGIMLKVALDAAAALSREGIEAGILHLPTLKPLDAAALVERAAQVPVVVTVEEHTVIGGLGSAVAEVVAGANFFHAKRFKCLGIPDVFPDEYGSQATLLERYRLTAAHLAATVKTLSAGPAASPELALRPLSWSRD